MKKTILLISFMGALSVSTLFSQTYKGRFLVAGSSNLNYSLTTTYPEYDGEKGDERKSSSFQITPSIGFFVQDNIAITLNLGIESSSNRYENESKTKLSNVLIGPGINVYFGETNIKPYLQGDLMFGAYTSKHESNSWSLDDFESKGKSMAYDLGAGVAIFLNNYLAIDMAFGYGAMSLIDKDDKKNKSRTEGLAIEIGVTAVF